MNWFTQTFTSTIGKKLIMALTGLFLIIFLIVHLIGNLQLFVNDEGVAFNKYSQFMSTNPVIGIVAYGLYAGFLIHIIWSVLLVLRNRKARPVGYAVTAGSKNSSWSSRNMFLLGSIIFIFLVVHLQNFWYQVQIGSLPTTEIDGEEVENLYASVKEAFSQGWIVALYVIAMVALGYHLLHGFSSAFQTLGLNHKKYTPVIRFLAWVYSIVVPALFALMPIYYYFFLS